MTWCSRSPGGPRWAGALAVTGLGLATASVHESHLNGHLPSVSVRVPDCVFTHPTEATDDHVSWVLTASGSGQLVIDGGRAAPRPDGAVHALRTVGDSDIALSTPVPCLGLS